MTHVEPNMEILWKLRLEDQDWITKATSSISWSPHFLGLIDFIKQVGFKKVEIAYPEVFNRNFPVEKYSARLYKVHKRLYSYGIKLGFFKNMEPGLTKTLPVNPLYFAYILEK